MTRCKVALPLVLRRNFNMAPIHLCKECKSYRRSIRNRWKSPGIMAYLTDAPTCMHCPETDALKAKYGDFRQTSTSKPPPVDRQVSSLVHPSEPKAECSAGPVSSLVRPFDGSEPHPKRAALERPPSTMPPDAPISETPQPVFELRIRFSQVERVVVTIDTSAYASSA